MDVSKPRLSFFVCLRALPSWLRLPRPERDRIATEALGAALEGRGVTMRHFDAEAFSADCSDIALFEAEEALSFNRVMEALRDTPLFTEPFFELVRIIPAIEDGFRHYERMQA